MIKSKITSKMSSPSPHPPIPPLFNLSGRTALVTGAAGHLGAAISQGLCEFGAHVYLNGRTEEKLKSLAAGLRKKRLHATIASGDITNPKDRQKIVDTIRKQHGRLDIFVNNASNGKTGTMMTITPEDFRNAYEISVVAPFALMQKCFPLLRKTAKLNAGGSSIINIASMYGIVSPDLSIYQDGGHHNPPSYGAAKAGLIQLTRYAACEWGKDNVRVNAIAPGPFPGGNVRKLYPKLWKSLEKKTPLGRTGLPEELVGAVVFLGADAGAFVTGECLRVDGGWTAW